jgi:prepilin-type N-terminal cleavage/methylation domain-containing protein
MKPKNRMSAPEGFTLVEMTMVLVIIGLLIGGLMMPLRTQMNHRRIAETRQTLNEIREALMGFAVVNGRFPCPARPETETGASHGGIPAGMEDNTRTFGVLPWATLGLSETDPWGRRLSYRVSPGFAVPFGLNTLGNITVLNAVGGSTLADQIPAVIIAHGKNGFNAWLPSGSRMPVSTDENENANNMAATEFVSKTPTATFDDLIAWISPGVLMNRMVAAGRLP